VTASVQVGQTKAGRSTVLRRIKGPCRSPLAARRSRSVVPQGPHSGSGRAQQPQVARSYGSPRAARRSAGRAAWGREPRAAADRAAAAVVRDYGGTHDPRAARRRSTGVSQGPRSVRGPHATAARCSAAGAGRTPQQHVARGYDSPNDARAARRSGTGVPQGPRVAAARACRRGPAAGVPQRPRSGRAPRLRHERRAARRSRTGVPQGPRSGRAPRAAAARRARLRQSARAARRALQPHGRAAGVRSLHNAKL
jgi:hypothetical protein